MVKDWFNVFFWNYPLFLEVRQVRGKIDTMQFLIKYNGRFTKS